MANFTHLHLDDIDDMAPKFGIGDIQEARFANDALGCEQTGMAFFRIRPGARQPFAHRHGRQEELYVVIGGTGRAWLDGEVVELDALDALRVAPETARSFEAGLDGLQLLAFGTPALAEGRDDAEMLDISWDD